MSAPEPTYRKLPGRGLGWSGFARFAIDNHFRDHGLVGVEYLTNVTIIY